MCRLIRKRKDRDLPHTFLSPEDAAKMKEATADARRSLQEAGLWEIELEARREIARRVREHRPGRR